MELTILGTSSSQPTPDRFCTSQILHYKQDLFMIDCGEGAQIQLTRFQIKRNKIKVIFISHLHGDHFYGLPGVLTSFMHYDRTDPLLVIGPIGIKKYIEYALQSSNAFLQFELQIKELENTTSEIVYKSDELTVTSVPLIHNVYCNGYLFEYTPQTRKIKANLIEKYALDYEAIKLLKQNQPVTTKDGNVIDPDEICFPFQSKKSYAFLSDTGFAPSIIPIIQNASVIYHETTYLKDLTEEAINRKHSTTHQAATIAKSANVGQLITGHYSSRYKDISLFKSECKEIFENTILGIDGLHIAIN
jgi:ribonuclease Z